MITPEQYQHLWDTAVIDAKRQNALNLAVATINRNYDRYKEVTDEVGTITPYILGVIHYRESSFNFSRHLHNGDKLTARTVHVPTGRPLGKPPFTWEESAIDALKLRGLDKVKRWAVPETLKQLEMYNGGGYQKRGINSPYLWAATNHYGTAPNTGKYVADGKFDITVLDQQLGCAAILKELLFS